MNEVIEKLEKDWADRLNYMIDGYYSGLDTELLNEIMEVIQSLENQLEKNRKFIQEHIDWCTAESTKKDAVVVMAREYLRNPKLGARDDLEDALNILTEEKEVKNETYKNIY